MDRKTLIDFIPKPTNNDVILYDLSLKNLIDENVFDEYNKLLPIYYETKKNYQYYKNNIEEYKKNLNGIYLYRTDWSEDDYLLNLQNAKKTYTNLYGPIKRIESNIETLQKKIKLTDEKIQFQITKENKDFEDRKNNIDKKIDDNVDKLMSLKEVFSTLKIEKEKIAEAVEPAREKLAEAVELAKEKLAGAGEATKEKLAGAGNATKELISNAGGATKEIITNAGSATKDMIYSAGNAAKDKLTAGAASKNKNQNSAMKEKWAIQRAELEAKMDSYIAKINIYNKHSLNSLPKLNKSGKSINIKEYIEMLKNKKDE